MKPSRQARLTRRIIVSSLLAAAAIWYLAIVLEFDIKTLLGFVSASFMLVIGAAALALVCISVFKLMRRKHK